MVDNSRLEPLRTDPWASLFDVPIGQEARHKCQRRITESRTSDGATSATQHPVMTQVTTKLPIREHILAVDVVHFLDSPFNERQKRLGFSARQLEDAKQGLLNKGLIKEVWLGKNLMLAPTGKLYCLLGMESPYGDSEWDVHTFLTILGARLFELNPLVKYVKRAVPLDASSPSTIDFVAYLKDGNRLAFEVIHRCITNIAGHAAKLIGKNFAQLVFLCTDFNQKERVRAVIRNCGFDPDFLSTIRYQIFSSLLRQKRQMMLRYIP